MTATAQNFSMTSGDNHKLRFTIKDELGAVVDVTGATFEWGLAEYSSNDPLEGFSGPTLISKSTGLGITIIDALNGLVDVDLDPADTDDLVGIYYHELEMTLGGKITTVAVGLGTITGDLLV